MDQKQFDLFQTGIQWVADEMRRDHEGSAPNGLRHRQTTWAAGRVTDEVINYHSENSSIGFEGTVVCPTAGCVAGNFCAINGDTFILPRKGYVGAYAAVVEHVVDDEGAVYMIGYRGMKLAGLTPVEADRLFNSNNSRADVIWLAKQIAENHGYTLEVIT